MDGVSRVRVACKPGSVIPRPRLRRDVLQVLNVPLKATLLANQRRVASRNPYVALWKVKRYDLGDQWAIAH
jgi:hypothetical protein